MQPKSITIDGGEIIIRPMDSSFNPTFCMHGGPIPRGKECSEANPCLGGKAKRYCGGYLQALCDAAETVGDFEHWR